MPYTIVRSYSKIQTMQSVPTGCPERLHLAAINSHVLFQLEDILKGNAIR